MSHCLISEMPLGFMPLLEFDGKPLSQSMAINRLLARQFGMFLKCNLNAIFNSSSPDKGHDPPHLL